MHRRMVKSWVLAGASAVTIMATEATAQGIGRTSQRIPPGHRPPAGQCRVWYDDRPPGHQPAPTSCTAARREAHRTGGRVVYGSEQRDVRWDGDDRNDREGDGKWERDDGKWEQECDARERARGECGWSDRDRTRGDLCRDGDRDGWCDYAERGYPAGTSSRSRRYPATLPDMVWGVVYNRGDRAAQRGVRQWLGSADVRARYVDMNRNGRPEVVSWMDDRGVVVQRWVDRTGDGRADRVDVYERGRVVRVLQ